MKLHSGFELQGRYRVVRLLGEGGYGAVYLIQDLRLGGKRLALKESFDNSQEAQQQFQLEASLLANLTHPHLPRVSDYFIERTGRQYLVMDFVEGHDLTDLLIQSPQGVPIEQAVRWMSQICQAVAYLHSQQPHPIIHRDIKPSNIKINAAGQAVLVDFGIAKLYVPSKGTARIAKAVSSGFSPPEQYAGNTDTRSDVYALGATLYSMLTCRVPPDAFERLVSQVPLPPPSYFNPSLSPALEQVVLRTMEVDSRRRFDSAAELLHALQATFGALSSSAGAPSSCTACAHPNRAGAKFCQRCGNRLTTAGHFSPAVVSPPPATEPPELSFEIANAYARAGKLQEALHTYQRALAGGFTDPALYHNLGLCHIQLNQYADAIRVLQQGIARHDDDPELYYQLGRAFLQLDQLQQSVQALENAKRLNPKDVATRLLLAMIFQNAKLHPAAITELKQAIKLSKKEPLAHFLLGKSYLLTDQPAQAEGPLREALRLSADEPDHHYFLGVALHHQKKHGEAIPLLEQTIKLAPDHFMAHYILGEVFMAQKKWREAGQYFLKSAKLDPSDPDPHTSLAICLAMLGNKAEALNVVLQALAISPNNQRARNVMKQL